MQAVGPILAGLVFTRQRLEPHRADRWWWIAAVCLGLPWVARGHVRTGIAVTVQILLAWLVFRSVSALRQRFAGRGMPRSLGAGLAAGVTVNAGIIVAAMATSNRHPDVAGSLRGLASWPSDPVALGHAMLVISVLLAITLPTRFLRSWALAVGAGMALASGAQEVMVAWLLVAVGLHIAGERRDGVAATLTEWGLIAMVVVVTAAQLGFVPPQRAEVQSAPSASSLATGVLPASDGGERPTLGALRPDRSGMQGAAPAIEAFGGPGVRRLPAGGFDLNLRDLPATRVSLWQEAVRAAFTGLPWGWGPGGMSTAMYAIEPSERQPDTSARHAHNLVLDTWLERGWLGVLGLVLLLAVMALRALQQRDRAMVVVLAGVFFLNLFDTTLFNPAVLYPLAAGLGWRAVGHREIAESETGYGSAAAVRIALMATDAVVAFIAITIGLVVAFDGSASDAVLVGWTPSLAYAALLWPVLMWSQGLYPGYGRELRDEMYRSTRAVVAATVTLGFISALISDQEVLSPRAIVIAGMVSLIASPVARASAKRVLVWARLWGRPVVVLGAGPTAARVVRHLLGRPSIGLRPVAVFGDGAWDVPLLPITGALDAVWDAIRDLRTQHIIVTPDASRSVGFDEILCRAEQQLRSVHFLPDLHGVPASSVTSTPLGTELGLEVRVQLASPVNRALKRALDLVGSIVLLMAFSPILLLLAVMIRLDSPGPALYHSPRIGRRGREFRCVKFRSMYLDADDRLTQLLASEPRLREEYVQFHKLADDPRVTRIGRALRRLSLDELPQLINVARGDMSLVGPRPYLVRERDGLGTARDLILLARPGMTGFWQVEGRNGVTFEDRQLMEAAYVRNWSLWWDIEILVRTPLVLAARTGR